MSLSIAGSPVVTVFLIGGLMNLLPGCSDEAHQAPGIREAAIIEIAMPEKLGPMQRPAVEFKHDKHVKALEKQGCQECHPTDEKKKLRPHLKKSLPISIIEGLTACWEEFGLAGAGVEVPAFSEIYADFYHDVCLGCHQKMRGEGQKTGPEECGECHLKLPPFVSSRRRMGFDQSLHYRHVRAEKEKCENCHHVYNEKLAKLEYKKGQESNCRDCHGEKDVGKNLSWQNAAHTDCISCHLKNKENAGKTKTPEDKQRKLGPTDCAGCHDEKKQEAVEKLDKVPRLKRMQPDRIWIRTPKASSRQVAFNHQAHEPQTYFCSTCHHRTLKKCGECHSFTGNEKGAGVTLQQAQHLSGSEYSCVGCHQLQTEKAECAGCHHSLPGPPNRQSCVICHSGPQPKAVAEQPTAAPEDPAGARKEPPEELFKEVELARLPAPSKEVFPENLEIDIGGKEYQPTKFPHLKIVTKLDKLSRKSKLANRFHRVLETTCAGCHHFSPVGVRPPPCKACHGDVGYPTRDKPALKAAFHRQCIGCHQRMAQKQQECEDCHKKEKASKEVEK